MDQQQNQHLLDLPKVIAVGIASPAGAALTSRFGVAGTLVGLALSAVIITVVTDFLKVYLARVPRAVTSIPGSLRKKSAFGRFVPRFRLPFSKVSPLPPARRRSLLVGSVIAGGIAFLVGLIIITGVEASVGKSLSCWVWNECPEAASSSDGTTASTTTSTLPSILGGGASANTTPSQGSPSNLQPTAPSPLPSSSPGASPISPLPPPASPGSQTPNPLPQSTGEQESSSNSSEEGYEQPSPESAGGADQQQPTPHQQSEQTQSTDTSRGGQREAPPPLHWFTT